MLKYEVLLAVSGKHDCVDFEIWKSVSGYYLMSQITVLSQCLLYSKCWLQILLLILL